MSSFGTLTEFYHNIGADLPKQTVEIQIRLLLEQSDLGLHCAPVIQLFDDIWMLIFKSASSNCRMITVKILKIGTP